MSDAPLPSLWHGMAANWRSETGAAETSANVDTLLTRFASKRDRALAEWRGLPPQRPEQPPVLPIAAE